MDIQDTIGILVAEEMYYGLIFPLAKQYKTVRDELTIYLSKLNWIDTGITWRTKRVHNRDKSCHAVTELV